MSLQASASPVRRARGASMRTAVLIEPGRFDIADAPRPAAGDEQVCVRVEGCGICGSNLPPWEGRPWFKYPFEAGAPGHEAWGTIEATGAKVRGVRLGQRVAVISYHGFAEFDLADARAIVPLPDTLRQFPGEPLGCAANVFARSQIKAGQTVAIVGVGFLGALVTQLASHAGARVIAISRRRFATAIAKRCGAAATIEWDNSNSVIENVKQLTADALCPTVIECVGTQEALDLASELTAVRGKLVIAGYHQDGSRSVDMQSWNWRGLDVINAHERDPAIYRAGIDRAVKAAERGAVSLEPLLTHRFELRDIELAFRYLAERPDGFLKAWIST